MKQSLLSLILLSIALFCCKKENPPSEPQAATTRIRFDALAVGQISRFLALSGEMYFSDKDIFVHMDDTLRLEIIEKDAVKGFKVAETLQYNGDVHEWMNSDKDATFYYYLRVENDTLRITPHNSSYINSRIFTYKMAAQGLPLKKYDALQTNLTGWKTELDYCECRREAYTLNYTLFNKTYDHLNVLLENSPMAWDGNGMTYAYSKAAGIVRFSTYSWWTQTGIGWDYLPE
jgi:hypothetical protein